MCRGSLIHCFLLPRSPFTFRITEVPSLWLLSSLTAWIILQICLWLHTTLELCAICAMLSEIQNELQIKVADVAFKIHVLYQFCWLHSSQAKYSLFSSSLSLAPYTQRKQICWCCELRLTVSFSGRTFWSVKKTLVQCSNSHWLPFKFTYPKYNITKRYK